MTAVFNLGAMIGNSNTNSNEVRQLSCDVLIPYHNHKFSLYTGERLNDMVESIRKNGVLIPIVVQPKGEQYEILIGHNRWNASKLAGRETIPAIIKSDLTEEEAEIYVTESNLMQRGFDDLKISERAAIIAERYKDIFDMKKLEEIRSYLAKLENKEEITDNDEVSSSNESEHKLRIMARYYGLGRSTIARLLRINELTDSLKECVDMGAISVRAGVELSYLPENAQIAVYNHHKDTYLNDNNNTWITSAAISEKAAKKYRELFNNGWNGGIGAAKEMIEQLEQEEATEKKPKPKVRKIHTEVYEKYFKEDESEDYINEILDKALEMYFNAENK